MIRILAAVLAAVLSTQIGWQAVAVASTALPPGAVKDTPAGHYWPAAAYDTPTGAHAEPDAVYYYRDDSGRLAMVTVDGRSLVIRTYDPQTFVRLQTRRVALAGFDHWGGFLAAADGNLYVALGRANYEESATKTVVVVRKYSKQWELLGEAAIPGGVRQGQTGITEAFHAGVGRMALCGGTLVLHMSRLLFRSDDGLRHQMNLTLTIDTGTMATRTFADAYNTYPYVSHSFNQFVDCRGGDLVVADHGDAYPRAIVAGVMRGFPPTGEGRMDRRRLWQLPGKTGNNYTGTTLTGLAVADDGFLVVGNSVPHRNAVGGLTGSASRLPRNVYLIRSGLDANKPEFTWLTRLTGRNSGASEPRLVPVDAGRWAVLFTTTRGPAASRRQTMQYRLIDASGTVLASRSWRGRAFFPASDPILLGERMVWAQRSDSRRVPGADRGYLYTLDLTDPASPRSPRSAKVKVEAVNDRSRLRVDVNPDTGSSQWTFQVQKRRANATWTKVRTYRTTGARRTRTVDLPKGTYRVVVNPQRDRLGAVSRMVRLLR